MLGCDQHAETADGRRGYQRRQSGKSALYRIIDGHYEAVLAQAQEHGAGYPAFVRKEFERYLLCGRLCGGFSRLVCKACGYNHLLAFSCKGRLCPSCANRRMEQTALFLTARVLPKVPYRQWTLSLPWRIRWAVATKPKLLSAALAVMQRRIFAWQRRAARAAGIGDPLCGSVTFVQRFDCQLRLYPHFHTIVPDGVFSRTDDGTLAFTALPPPSDSEVAKLVLQIGRRIEELVTLGTDEAVDDEQADALQLSLVEAAQPLHRSRFRPPEADALSRQRPRCAQLDGYSLHADVAVADHDRRGLQRLLRYGARPPLAASRVSWSAADGKVVYKLRKPTAAGRTELRMTPQQFIGRLAALTPPPWLHAIRFHGVFASASAHRRAVAQTVAAEQDPHDDPFACRPLSRGDVTDAQVADPDAPVAEAAMAPPPHIRIAWSELLRRSFGDPLVCPRCQGRMRLIAVIKDPKTIAAILAHPAHRDDHPHSGLDPPQLGSEANPSYSPRSEPLGERERSDRQLHLDLQAQLEPFGPV